MILAASDGLVREKKSVFFFWCLWAARGGASCTTMPGSGARAANEHPPCRLQHLDEIFCRT